MFCDSFSLVYNLWKENRINVKRQAALKMKNENNIFTFFRYYDLLMALQRLQSWINWLFLLGKKKMIVKKKCYKQKLIFKNNGKNVQISYSVSLLELGTVSLIQDVTQIWALLQQNTPKNFFPTCLEALLNYTSISLSK